MSEDRLGTVIAVKVNVLPPSEEDDDASTTSGRAFYTLEDEFDELSLRQLLDKSPEDLANYFKPYSAGIAHFFWNQNTRLLPTDKVIATLNAMMARKLRFFPYTLYNVLFYSREVQEWAIENMKCLNSNELYISDDENY